jgi:hypothetical protein
MEFYSVKSFIVVLISLQYTRIVGRINGLVESFQWSF